jgi:hypothetical protein
MIPTPTSVHKNGDNVTKQVPEVHKMIARAAVDVFGGSTKKVHTYWDDNHQSHIALASSADSPWRGVTSYATVGLSDLPIMFDGHEFPARVELVGACATDTEVFANILTTAAFCVINSGWVPRLGAIFTDVLTMYPSASTTMQHLLLAAPWLWTPNLDTLRLADRTVAWLHAVPISEEEHQFARSNGTDALESKFEEQQIDVFDLNRAPISI